MFVMQMSVQAHLVQKNVLLEKPVRPNRLLEIHVRDERSPYLGKSGLLQHAGLRH